MVAAAAAMLLRSARARVGVASAIVVVEALVLFLVPDGSAPRSVTVDTAPVVYLQRHLGSARFLTLGPLQPNYGSYFGVSSLNVNDVPVPTAFVDYVRERLDQAVQPEVFVGSLGGGRPPSAPSPKAELLRNLAAYRTAGVAYVLTQPGQKLPATFMLVLRSPTTWIYHLARPDPLISAPGCIVAAGADAVQLTCRRRTLLVRRETALPGWHATLDGHSAGLQNVDGLFQALPIGPGRHLVAFSYSPPHLDWAIAAFVLGCAALGLQAARQLRTTAAPRCPT